MLEVVRNRPVDCQNGSRRIGSEFVDDLARTGRLPLNYKTGLMMQEGRL